MISRNKQELVSVFSVRTSIEDTAFQPKLAELAPGLVCQTGGQPTHTPGYKYL